MSKQWIRCLMAGAMLALSVGSAQAATVFSNLNNPSVDIGTNIGPIVGTAMTFDTVLGGPSNVLAQSFIAPASFAGINNKLADVFLRFGLNPDTGANAAAPLVNLWADDGTGSAPVITTTPLATFTMQGTLNTDILDRKFIPDNPFFFPTTTTATTYWISFASPNSTTAIDWSVTDATAVNGVNATYTYSFTGVAANAFVFFADYGAPAPYGSDPTQFTGNNGQIYQMQVDTVPEPSTYALLLISLGVVGYARKRMTTKA